MRKYLAQHCVAGGACEAGVHIANSKENIWTRNKSTPPAGTAIEAMLRCEGDHSYSERLFPGVTSKTLLLKTGRVPRLVFEGSRPPMRFVGAW